MIKKFTKLKQIYYPIKSHSFRYFKNKIEIIILFSLFLSLNDLIKKNFLLLKQKDFIQRNIKKRIFSFWEPKEKIPGYLCLCIKTWKKYLSQYEIIILDYKGAKKYIGDRLFNSVVNKNMSLPIQADAIRVALLKKYGGIWMDTDTLITNGAFLKNLEKYELIMLGTNNMQHMGFIMASTKSLLLDKWLIEIINRVHKYRKIYESLNIGTRRVAWNYLGSDIIDRLINTTKPNQFYRLNKHKINAFPEIKFFKNTSLNAIQKYKQFYFQKREPEIVLNNTKGIICLHNSWTPIKYKNMSEKEFLKEDILLSKLLSQILNIRI